MRSLVIPLIAVVVGLATLVAFATVSRPASYCRKVQLAHENGRLTYKLAMMVYFKDRSYDEARIDAIADSIATANGH